MRFGFICVPSASRGHADERAFYLLLNALDGPTADATLAGNFRDAFAETQLSLDALFKCGIDPRPTELLALCYGALKASMHPLPDHAALKLGKRAADLKHELAGRCGGVDRQRAVSSVWAAPLPPRSRLKKGAD